jgi:ubiquinone/menaquinone biosynthesis C-methylase UbiE
LSGADQYFLGYRPAEQERLQQQAEQLAEEARRLFERIGVGPGARVLEIGCGPRGCLDLLAERVGPTGKVVGVERSEDSVNRARKLVAERSLGNIEVLHVDARYTGLARSSFDFVTARLVLVNVPAPEEIVAEAAALVRPGGTVAFHEADAVARVFDPPLPAWARLNNVLEAYAKLNGIDSFIGRRVPRLLREHGLVDIQINPLIYSYPPGHARRMLSLHFVENLSERLVAQQLISDRELNDLKEDLRRHLENPETLVISHLFIQAWGRKPD